MRRTLLFTTLANQQPTYNNNNNNNKTIHLENSHIEEQNQPKTRTLQELLIRSTQPIFSVSAMFVARTSGGCGACGH